MISYVRYPARFLDSDAWLWTQARYFDGRLYVSQLIDGNRYMVTEKADATRKGIASAYLSARNKIKSFRAKQAESNALYEKFANG